MDWLTTAAFLRSQDYVDYKHGEVHEIYMVKIKMDRIIKGVHQAASQGLQN